MKYEILAPCGNKEAFYAAIEAGCDAVYLAGKMFGARAFSNNFTNEELVEIINYAHLFDVKVYVTCNILIYENEVDKFLEYVGFLHKNNVDAIIIQDLGMVDLIHKTYPNLELHGSTQMHIHNLDGALMAKKLGLKRIVLARETPIEVIKDIKEKSGLEIEVFVHGALCASYSGMCLFAKSIGPRSGNRGTCSGCCRLPYDILDNNNNVLNEGKYPLSMRDLNTVSELDKLIDLGITSFKIEGRMKSPSYVYSTVSLYKEARDSYLNTKSLLINQKYLDNLNNIFSRGYTKGFIFNDKNIINDKFPNHKGILIGEVIEYNKNYVSVKLFNNISIHDGLRIVNNDFEYGHILNEFKLNGKLVHEANKNDIIKFKVNKIVPVGSKIYRTLSYKIENEIDSIIKNKKRRIPISFTIEIRKNKNIILTVNDGNNSIKVVGIKPDIANNKPISKEDIKEKLLKVNETIYKVNDINIVLDKDLFIPISVLNNMKREILDKLSFKRLEKYKKNYVKKEYYISVNDYKKCNKYTLFTNNKKYIDKKYSYIYSEELSNTIKKLPKVINNYDDYSINNEYLVGEIGALNKFSNIITDYSFNVTNSYTVAFLHSLGVKRVTLSVEMNEKNIVDLINNYKIRYNSNPNLELIIKTRFEVMVLKYDLSIKYKNCKYLKDRFNNKYLIVRKNNLTYIYDYKEKRINDYQKYFDLGINYLRDEYYN